LKTTSKQGNWIYKCRNISNLERRGRGKGMGKPEFLGHSKGI